jgi:hypothetical protein
MCFETKCAKGSSKGSCSNLSPRTDHDWLIDILNSAKRIDRALNLKLSIEREELFFDAIQYNFV